MKKINFLFLKDVVIYTFTAFGGAQAHMSLLLKMFIENKQYITEAELLEINALAQILPGPSSTQTLVGVAYKVGGHRLAILSFLIWIVPSALVMIFLAVSFGFLDEKDKFISIVRFVQPIALGIIVYGAYRFGSKILKDRISIFLAISACAATLILKNAYVFPIIILIGGMISSALQTSLDESQLRVQLFANINPKKLGYFIGILLLMASLGAIVNRTSPFSLPIRLFENFYRNGIFVFGGGQVLVPLMFTEFVEMKHYLSQSDFVSGFALQQILPGPVFSFSSFLGALSMKNASYGILGQFFGGILAIIGINLPGLILILFIVPFWDDLKKITRIRHSIIGINAVSVGFIIASSILLIIPIGFDYFAIGIMIATFLLLKFTKVYAPFIVLLGILLGFIL